MIASAETMIPTLTCLPLLCAPLLAGDDHPFETDALREPSLVTGGSAVVRNATVHTAVGPAFVGTVVVSDGKITAVVEGDGDVSVPDGALEIDAGGMHLAPGVVDTHSHIAIERGVNEGTVSISADVTIEDCVNADDLSIYRALAGGVTTIRQLHGSANAIGGRDSVIKLKWKENAQALRFPGAERGIKFALGENPKRSNSFGRRAPGESRYPATRMGVESIYYRAFERAKEYRAEWEAYGAAKAAGEDPAAPRRDVRLAVLVDILEQDVIVHSHCYRADEILMLIRASQHFGFRIGTLQHVLEGYKVAHEMAEAGVPGSTFPDWWAYKVEAYDAIPHGAALMAEAGVLSSINSDSGEMMRRLYEEAAKSVRYAGMDRVEALKLVTLNGALQLGIDDRVGSIEVGKDADLVLLNGDPLSSLSRVAWTMVDGEIEFQRRDAFGLDSEPPAVAEIDEPDLEVPVAAGAAVALVGGTIHTVTNGTIEGGTLLLRGDRIIALGTEVEVPWDAQVIDVSGQHVWPGMISLNSQTGLHEIGAVRSTNDTSEAGGDQPDLRVSASLNADSAHIGVTRHNGITRAQTAPQGGGPIRGQSSVVRLVGDTWEEMLTVDRDMLQISFPSSSRGRFRPFDGHECDEICGHERERADCMTSGAPPQTPPQRRPGQRRPDAEGERDETQENERVGELRKLFDEARTYGRLRDAAAAGGPAPPSYDPRLEALVPYARGEKPVGLHASDAQTILFAVKFAREENLDAVIYGGRDAWKVVDVLAEAQIPVVVGPVWSTPRSSYDPYDAPFAGAAVLARAGVPFAIMTADSNNERNLAFHAAKAAAFGLPVEEAVRAVTYYPARILGIDDRFGSLRPGKVADVIVTDGHLLEIDAPLTHLFIDGREIDLGADKHSRLYERYRARMLRLRTESQ